MRIINKDTIDKPSFIKGAVPIFALSSDKEQVLKQVSQPLLEAGYYAQMIEHEPKFCQSLPFAKLIKETISASQCAVIVFSQAIKDDSNLKCLQMLFYEYGLLEGQSKQVYPLLLDASAGELESVFRGRPFSNVQGVNDIEKIKDELVICGVPRELYFPNDDVLNSRVIQRVKFVRLTVTLDVRLSTLEEIWRKDARYWDESEPSFSDSAMDILLETLFAELKVGAFVSRFGKEITFEQEFFRPYKEESQLIKFDSPAHIEKNMSISPKRIIESDRDAADSDIIARTLRLDFYLPVHDILGTSYLPYFALKRSKGAHWKSEHIKLLLEHDKRRTGDPAANHTQAIRINYDEKGKRNLIYFLLPGPTEELNPELAEEYGSICNFIYPK